MCTLRLSIAACIPAAADAPDAQFMRTLTALSAGKARANCLIADATCNSTDILAARSTSEGKSVWASSHGMPDGKTFLRLTHGCTACEKWVQG